MASKREIAIKNSRTSIINKDRYNSPLSGAILKVFNERSPESGSPSTQSNPINHLKHVEPECSNSSKYILIIPSIGIFNSILKKHGSADSNIRIGIASIIDEATAENKINAERIINQNVSTTNTLNGTGNSQRTVSASRSIETAYDRINIIIDGYDLPELAGGILDTQGGHNFCPNAGGEQQPPPGIMRFSSIKKPLIFPLNIDNDTEPGTEGIPIEEQVSQNQGTVLYTEIMDSLKDSIDSTIVKSNPVIRKNNTTTIIDLSVWKSYSGVLHPILGGKENLAFDLITNRIWEDMGTISSDYVRASADGSTFEGLENKDLKRSLLYKESIGSRSINNVLVATAGMQFKLKSRQWYKYGITEINNRNNIGISNTSILISDNNFKTNFTSIINNISKNDNLTNNIIKSIDGFNRLGSIPYENIIDSALFTMGNSTNTESNTEEEIRSYIGQPLIPIIARQEIGEDGSLIINTIPTNKVIDRLKELKLLCYDKAPAIEMTRKRINLRVNIEENVLSNDTVESITGQETNISLLNIYAQTKYSPSSFEYHRKEQTFHPLSIRGISLLDEMLDVTFDDYKDNISLVYDSMILKESARLIDSLPKMEDLRGNITAIEDGDKMPSKYISSDGILDEIDIYPIEFVLTGVQTNKILPHKTVELNDKFLPILKDQTPKIIPFEVDRIVDIPPFDESIKSTKPRKYSIGGIPKNNRTTVVGIVDSMVKDYTRNMVENRLLPNNIIESFEAVLGKKFTIKTIDNSVNFEDEIRSFQKALVNGGNIFGDLPPITNHNLNINNLLDALILMLFNPYQVLDTSALNYLNESSNQLEPGVTYSTSNIDFDIPYGLGDDHISSSHVIEALYDLFIPYDVPSQSGYTAIGLTCVYSIVTIDSGVPVETFSDAIMPWDIGWKLEEEIRQLITTHVPQNDNEQVLDGVAEASRDSYAPTSANNLKKLRLSVVRRIAQNHPKSVILHAAAVRSLIQSYQLLVLTKQEVKDPSVSDAMAEYMPLDPQQVVLGTTTDIGINELDISSYAIGEDLGTLGIIGGEIPSVNSTTGNVSTNANNRVTRYYPVVLNEPNEIESLSKVDTVIYEIDSKIPLSVGMPITAFPKLGYRLFGIEGKRLLDFSEAYRPGFYGSDSSIDLTILAGLDYNASLILTDFNLQKIEAIKSTARIIKAESELPSINSNDPNFYYNIQPPLQYRSIQDSSSNPIFGGIYIDILTEDILPRGVTTISNTVTIFNIVKLNAKIASISGNITWQAWHPRSLGKSFIGSTTNRFATTVNNTFKIIPDVALPSLTDFSKVRTIITPFRSSKFLTIKNYRTTLIGVNNNFNIVIDQAASRLTMGAGLNKYITTIADFNDNINNNKIRPLVNVVQSALNVSGRVEVSPYRLPVTNMNTDGDYSVDAIAYTTALPEDFTFPLSFIWSQSNIGLSKRRGFGYAAYIFDTLFKSKKGGNGQIRPDLEYIPLVSIDKVGKTFDDVVNPLAGIYKFGHKTNIKSTVNGGKREVTTWIKVPDINSDMPLDYKSENRMFDIYGTSSLFSGLGENSDKITYYDSHTASDIVKAKSWKDIIIIRKNIAKRYSRSNLLLYMTIIEKLKVLTKEYQSIAIPIDTTIENIDKTFQKDFTVKIPKAELSKDIISLLDSNKWNTILSKIFPEFKKWLYSCTSSSSVLWIKNDTDYIISIGIIYLLTMVALYIKTNASSGINVVIKNKDRVISELGKMVINSYTSDGKKDNIIATNIWNLGNTTKNINVTKQDLVSVLEQIDIITLETQSCIVTEGRRYYLGRGGSNKGKGSFSVPKNKYKKFADTIRAAGLSFGTTGVSTKSNPDGNNIAFTYSDATSNSKILIPGTLNFSKDFLKIKGSVMAISTEVDKTTKEINTSVTRNIPYLGNATEIDLLSGGNDSQMMASLGMDPIHIARLFISTIEIINDSKYIYATELKDSFISSPNRLFQTQSEDVLKGLSEVIEFMKTNLKSEISIDEIEIILKSAQNLPAIYKIQMLNSDSALSSGLSTYTNRMLVEENANVVPWTLSYKNKVNFSKIGLTGTYYDPNANTITNVSLIKKAKDTRLKTPNSVTNSIISFDTLCWVYSIIGCQMFISVDTPYSSLELGSETTITSSASSSTSSKNADIIRVMDSENRPSKIFTFAADTIHPYPYTDISLATWNMQWYPYAKAIYLYGTKTNNLNNIKLFPEGKDNIENMIANKKVLSLASLDTFKAANNNRYPFILAAQEVSDTVAFKELVSGAGYPTIIYGVDKYILKANIWENISNSGKSYPTSTGYEADQGLVIATYGTVLHSWILDFGQLKDVGRQDLSPGKIALAAHIEWQGKEFIVYNAHTKSNTGATRRRQVVDSQGNISFNTTKNIGKSIQNLTRRENYINYILSDLVQIKNNGIIPNADILPVFLLGDLNSPATNKRNNYPFTVKDDSKTYIDKIHKTITSNRGGFVNIFQNEIDTNNYATAKTTKVSNQETNIDFDHIYIRGLNSPVLDITPSNYTNIGPINNIAIDTNLFEATKIKYNSDHMLVGVKLNNF